MGGLDSLFQYLRWPMETYIDFCPDMEKIISRNGRKVSFRKKGNSAQGLNISLYFGAV